MKYYCENDHLLFDTTKTVCGQCAEVAPSRSAAPPASFASGECTKPGGSSVAPCRDLDNKPPGEISIHVFQQDWVPGFAAFHDDGCISETAKAHVILNIGSFMSAIQTEELDPKDLPYFIAESLMHEVIHVLEAWAKVEFSEDRVEALLRKYRQKYERATIWEYTGGEPHSEPEASAAPPSEREALDEMKSEAFSSGFQRGHEAARHALPPPEFELPTYKESHKAINAGNPTPIDILIYNHTPASSRHEDQFREEVLNAIRAAIDGARGQSAAERERVAATEARAAAPQAAVNDTPFGWWVDGELFYAEREAKAAAEHTTNKIVPLFDRAAAVPAPGEKK